MMLVNPLGPPAPVVPQAASPYYPTTRRFRNPLYLRVEDVPGAERLGPQLDRWPPQAAALNAYRRDWIATASSASSSRPCGRSGPTASAGDPAASTPFAASRARRWSSSPRSAPGRAVRRRLADVAGRISPARQRGRRALRRRSMPAKSAIMPGCNGCLDRQLAGAAAVLADRAGLADRHGSRRRGRLGVARPAGRGDGRSAPRPTPSTPTARTGNCRRLCRRSSGRPPTSRSSRRSARRCGTPAGCGSIT